MDIAQIGTAMKLIEQVRAYQPYNEQEMRDRELILSSLETIPNVFSRESTLAHMTASAWVVNRARTRVLMAYHNLYQSWAWLGGHADGEEDLLQVAWREAREESGIIHVKPVDGQIYSLESLPVYGHVKRGSYVSTHLHLNLTYLFEAEETDVLTAKPDENSGVAWFSLDDAVNASTELWMRDHVYRKLNAKLHR